MFFVVKPVSYISMKIIIMKTIKWNSTYSYAEQWVQALISQSVLKSSFHKVHLAEKSFEYGIGEWHTKANLMTNGVNLFMTSERQ